MSTISAIQLQYLQERISQHDDQWAYKELFLLFHGSLFSFARSLTKSKEAAEEIVSDVFVKIWERRSKLLEINRLKVYLFVATRHRAINYLEKQKRAATFDLDEISSDLRQLYPDPEQMMVTAELRERIYKAIRELPPRCRLIFQLVKEDELRYRDVAEILNISIKTVENQLAIAVRKIGAAVSFDISRTMLVPVSHSK